jgi:NADH-quinone oxidoreductase subunit M
MLLSVIVFLPLLFAAIVTFWPNVKTVRPLALGFSLIEFLISLLALQQFDKTTAALQLVEKYPWIERFGINYYLGLDGISLWLVLLTTFLIFVSKF